jgi:hypothetical protein
MKILSVFIFFSLSLSQNLYDGKFFDTGRTMSDVSKNAPKGLDALLPMLGAWTVTETAFRNDSAIASYTGHSEIALNNRGNSYMERTYMYKTMRGNADEYTMVLFTKAKFTGTWGKGVVSDYKENVDVYDGGFDGKTLILQNALRLGGGQKVQMEKLSYSIDKNEFSFITETSNDYGKTWTKTGLFARSSDWIKSGY